MSNQEFTLSDAYTVSVTLINVADSPRKSGENHKHSRALAEIDVNLPPIIVHRSTMRVIDGMHRLEAARLRGSDTIEVRYFDGTHDEAFILAVQSNIAHGLPLSLADRKCAAARIIISHPQWSDRAVATATGLAHKTVGALRKRANGAASNTTARVGLDGRTRPVNAAAGRQRAHELLIQSPAATTRQIAQDAGISPTTAKDVRDRVRKGEDPIQGGHDLGAPDPGGRSTVIVRSLRADPSLRFTETGRELLRTMDRHTRLAAEWARLADSVPEHCIGRLTELATNCARDWEDLAARLEQRLRER